MTLQCAHVFNIYIAYQIAQLAIILFSRAQKEKNDIHTNIAKIKYKLEYKYNHLAFLCLL